MAHNSTLPDKDDPTVNHTSLLILDKNGRLLRLQCPFMVLQKSHPYTGSNPKTFWVDAIRVSDKFLLMYIIRSKPYPYSLFVILLG